MAVPQLRPVTADEYGSLPSFIKSQLPLDLLNAMLEAVHTVAAERSSGGCEGGGGWLMSMQPFAFLIIVCA